MDNNHSQRLFFMEICIAFLFFLMIAVTCFLSFTKSKLLQIDANNQIQYVNITDNIAEVFLSTHDITEACDAFQNEFGHVTVSDNLVTYATDSLNIAIDLQQEHDIMRAIITIYENQQPVYQLSVKKALGEST